MEPKRKRKSAAVFKLLGILCFLFLLLMIVSGAAAIRRNTPKSTEDAPSAALLDGRTISAEQDYKLSVVPSFNMFSLKNSLLTRMLYPGTPHYYFGWFPDSYGDPYCCAICVYEGTDLYNRLQAYESDKTVPLSDVVKESYFAAENVAENTSLFQNRYAEARAWFENTYGDSFGDGRKLTDSGILFTYLGDTPEDYVTLKSETVKHKWTSGILIALVLLLPLIVLFFVLSSVQKRRFQKRLAAAQAEAPYAPTEIWPGAAPAPAVPEAAESAPVVPEPTEPVPAAPDPAEPTQQQESGCAASACGAELSRLPARSSASAATQQRSPPATRAAFVPPSPLP